MYVNLKISIASALKDGQECNCRRIMVVDLSDNFVMIKVLSHVDTFFTQNKAMNNHLKFGRCFTGHPIHYQWMKLIILL
jgi:hypothetical protein